MDDVNTKDQTLVLCFPRRLLGNKTGLLPASEFLRRIDAHKTFTERERAESSNELVQLVGCSLITDGAGRYRVLETPDQASYDSNGNMSLIVGGHVEGTEEDALKPAGVLISEATRREIEEELGRKPPRCLPMLGVLVDASSHRNSRHVGVLHECTLSGRIHPERSGEFVTDSEVAGDYSLARLGRLTHLMDPWSQIATRSLMRIYRGISHDPE